MNFNCITLHNETLDTIIDAAIPNKAQNAAVKRQAAQATDVLMNRIAEGWLNDSLLEAQGATPKEYAPPQKMAEETGNVLPS